MKIFGDAVILCGGKSTRMGFDKSLLQIDGEYVINIMAGKLCQIFDNVSLCANGHDKFERFGLPIIQDIYNEGIGPIAAIHAALKQAKSKYIFVVAVDMPLINLAYILHMMHVLEHTSPPPLAFAPLVDGFTEGTHAFYSIEALSAIEREIEAGNFALHRLLGKLNARHISEKASRGFDKDLDMFTNLNYPQDLEGMGGCHD
ncbi:MAG: molybdenum cofactor guanylyltransferase [Defluviitaleaceae bacterium]|nr:molybdenum cofactor guanylyltransferase [Defluviitaleaceae bacterium]